MRICTHQFRFGSCISGVVDTDTSFRPEDSSPLECAPPLLWPNACTGLINQLSLVFNFIPFFVTSAYVASGRGPGRVWTADSRVTGHAANHLAKRTSTWQSGQGARSMERGRSVTATRIPRQSLTFIAIASGKFLYFISTQVKEKKLLFNTRKNQ